MTKIYVTKYALTSGPFTVGAEVTGGSAFWYDNGYQQSVHRKEWWPTEDEAMADCERRRTEKLASIEKQKKKLTAMTFTITEVSNK
ncbi:hypothetical protein LVT46_04865 [Klebsiella quasipneumoniae subsp. similipneumoniae]|uniref:hypothetical protein n=1 Tax=Klebsiella quasipneumoniae TaxID=1463165 RepID=UPI001E4A6D02|nr:hypothetical protein [Klebsiella quasipneumoniae]MCD9997633.1 hypothetical protein [Klebsiella quasipneumoniae subsp. similipneumoniae]